MEFSVKDIFCSYCGTRFTEQSAWPRKCFKCYNDSYKNPIPIIVAIIPTYDYCDGHSLPKLLIEQRNIEPQKGGWAFPSGYIDFGETWQQAVVREMKEEVGVTTSQSDYELFDVVNATNGNILIFCVHKGLPSGTLQYLFSPNEEVSAIQFTRVSDVELCFPTHNEMWAKYNQGLLLARECTTYL